MARVVLEGYIDANSVSTTIHFTPATGYEVTNKQKPIDIMRIRRVYDKKPLNYWFQSRNKIKTWKKIRVTVEEIE